MHIFKQNFYRVSCLFTLSLSLIGGESSVTQLEIEIYHINLKGNMSLSTYGIELRKDNKQINMDSMPARSLKNIGKKASVVIPFDLVQYPLIQKSLL